MSEYLLTDIVRKIGSYNQSFIYDITFVDLVDLQVYMCVVDESFRNYTRSGWHNLVHGDVPYGLYAGLRRTAGRDRDGLPIISADSHPALIEPLTEAEIFRILTIRQEQLAI
jgi:hypothetical protein